MYYTLAIMLTCSIEKEYPEFAEGLKWEIIRDRIAKDDCQCAAITGNDPVSRNAYLTATVLAIIFGLTLLVILVVFAVTMTRRYVSKCCLHNVFMYVLH